MVLRVVIELRTTWLGVTEYLEGNALSFWVVSDVDLRTSNLFSLMILPWFEVEIGGIGTDIGQYFPYVFSFSSSLEIALGLHFKSFISFELILMYGIR